MSSRAFTGATLIMALFLDATGSIRFAAERQQRLDDFKQALIPGLGTTLGLLGVTVGTAYLARSIRGEQRPGSNLSGLAAVSSFVQLWVRLSFCSG